MDLIVEWSLLTEEGLQIPVSDKAAQTFEITLLPPDVFKWDLVSPTGETVNKGFAFAALTNWVFTASDHTRRAAAQLKPSDKRIQNWMGQAYNLLFGGPDAIQVADSTDAFPPETHRRILTPDEVLRTKNADALESALAFAAIAYEATFWEAKFVLVVSADDTPLAQTRYLFCWKTERDSWNAIDVGNVNTQSFATNMTEATKRLKLIAASGWNLTLGARV